MSQKVTKTNRDLVELVKNLNSTPAEKGSLKEAKLLKIAKKIKPIFESYSEKRDDLRLDNAYANKDGVLELNEDGGYRFTKDGLKELNKQIKSLLDEEFEFYQLTFSVEGIEDLFFLEGWVEKIKSEDTNDEGL